MTAISAIDIVVFSAMLLISVSMGIFFAIRDKKKLTVDNYYFGGRKASTIAVAASISVSFTSALSVVSFPVEVYMYGAVYAWDILAIVISKVAAALWFVPIYHKLKVTSVYEYLELRFNRKIRLASSALLWLNSLLYLGVAIYVPALSLSATTSLNLHVAIAATSVICVLYTTIGGMKAVLWTDLLQSLMMLAGTLGLAIATVYSVGGWEEFFKAIHRGKRDNLFKFDIDPRIRSSVWTIGIGFTIARCYSSCCSQVYAQRYLSCKSIKKANTALLLAIIPDVFLTVSSFALGLGLYAFFEGCDPISSGELEKNDQAIPHLALIVFQQMPGMTGLFIAAIFSGTLSTVSSGVNAMSAIVLHDFVLTYYPCMKQKTKILVSMALSAVFGLLVMTVAYLASLIEGNILLMMYAFAGVILGPMLSLFTMAAFMPWVNSKGAVCGFLCGIIAMFGIGMSSYFARDLYTPEPNGGKLPLSTQGCSFANYTYIVYETNAENYSILAVDSNLTAEVMKPTTVADSGTMTSYILSFKTTVLSISPYLFGFLSWLLCVICGSITSLFTGLAILTECQPTHSINRIIRRSNRGDAYEPSKLDWRLFAPGVKTLFYRNGLRDERKEQEMIKFTENITNDHL